MKIKPLAALAAASLACVALAGPMNTKNLDPTIDMPGMLEGDEAPTGLTLRSDDNKPVALESLWADGPVVVMFYRGGWCPYCTRELAKWEPKLSEVESLGVDFVAITMEKPEATKETAAKNAPHLRILSDTTGDVSRAFRLAFTLEPKTKRKYEGFGIDLSTNNANGEWELPAPGTYVIDSTGTIRYAWASWDYTKRAPVEKVLEAVKAVSNDAD